jgi:hypothetical protein
MEIPPAQLEWGLKNLPRRARGLINALEIPLGSKLYPKNPTADLIAYEKWLESADEWLRLYKPESAEGFGHSDFHEKFRTAQYIGEQYHYEIRLAVRKELMAKVVLLMQIEGATKPKTVPLSATYDKTTGVLLIGDLPVPIMVGCMQSRACEKLFDFAVGVPVPTDDLVEAVIQDSADSLDLAKDWKRTYRVCDDINRKVYGKGIKKQLIKCRRNTVVRLF